MERKKIFPCIWQAALLLIGITGLMLVVALVLTIVMGVLRIAIPLDTDTANYLSAFIIPLTNTIALILPVAAILFFTKSSFKEFISLGKTKAGIILPVMIALAGSIILESELDNVTRYFMPMPQFLINMFKGINSYALPSFLLLVIVAPFTEEFLCRGIVLRGLLSHHAAWKAIIASAILFSLFHINPYQFISAFMVGLLLGWVYWKTKSLWPCIFIHALHNLLPWLMMNRLFPLKIRGYSAGGDLNTVVFQPWWFDLTGAFMLILGVILLFRYFKTLDRDDPEAVDYDDKREDELIIEDGLELEYD